MPKHNADHDRCTRRCAILAFRRLGAEVALDGSVHPLGVVAEMLEKAPRQMGIYAGVCRAGWINGESGSFVYHFDESA